jgi:hypothetical protein
VHRRDNKRPLVPGNKVLEWGDRLATWLLRERDLRGFVPGKGWAHAIIARRGLVPRSRSRRTSPPTVTVVSTLIFARFSSRRPAAATASPTGWPPRP